MGQSRRQGLPTSSWWVCLEVARKTLGCDSAARSSHECSLMSAALAFVPSSGVQCQLSLSLSLSQKDRILKDRIEEEIRLKHWHSCHLPVLDLCLTEKKQNNQKKVLQGV